jgi:membrane-bound lytic murein transglycosylase B
MAFGHGVAGAEGVYDRHRYPDEKRAAFEAVRSRLTASSIRKATSFLARHRLEYISAERMIGERWRSLKKV